MRRAISVFAMIAVLGQLPSATLSARTPLPDSQQGLCRKPGVLPQLGAEAQQQSARPEPRRRGGKPEVAYAPPVPPPPPVMAPPPMPAPIAGSGEGDDTVVVTGSRIESSSLESASPVTVVTSDAAKRAEGSAAIAPPSVEVEERAMPGYMPPSRPDPRPRAGLLTAGEHDDLLNPELYADYVRKSDLAQQIPALPMLDTARVLTVAVKDRAGRPVPFAPVEVACADGGRLMLKTMADGTVAFFPQVDRLGSKVRVRAMGEDWRDVTIGRGWGGQRVDFTLPGQAVAAKKLDLMLVIDTTGSMGDEIRFLQSELTAIVGSIRQRHPGLDLKVGFVFYRDVGDDYVTSTWNLSSDVNAGQRELARHSANGGGDYPEAMEQALIRAAGQAWRPDAVKSLLLVADAPPHDENFGRTWLAAEHLRANRVHIVPVAASGVADKAEYAMRAMAAATQSRYTFLTDDSGIGNAHAAPAIDCYLVTKLDQLLRRVIDSQLSGRRIEPGDQEVIRTVGNYDKGKCVIPEGHRFQGE